MWDITTTREHSHFAACLQNQVTETVTAVADQLYQPGQIQGREDSQAMATETYTLPTFLGKTRQLIWLEFKLLIPKKECVSLTVYFIISYAASVGQFHLEQCWTGAAPK